MDASGFSFRRALLRVALQPASASADAAAAQAPWQALELCVRTTDAKVLAAVLAADHHSSTCRLQSQEYATGSVL